MNFWYTEEHWTVVRFRDRVHPWTERRRRHPVARLVLTGRIDSADVAFRVIARLRGTRVHQLLMDVRGPFAGDILACMVADEVAVMWDCVGPLYEALVAYPHATCMRFGAETLDVPGMETILDVVWKNSHLRRLAIFRYCKQPCPVELRMNILHFMAFLFPDLQVASRWVPTGDLARPPSRRTPSRIVVELRMLRAWGLPDGVLIEYLWAWFRVQCPGAWSFVAQLPTWRPATKAAVNRRVYELVSWRDLFVFRHSKPG